MSTVYDAREEYVLGNLHRIWEEGSLGYTLLLNKRRVFGETHRRLLEEGVLGATLI